MGCARFFLAFLAALRAFFRSRTQTALEVLALRQPVAVLKRKRPRPKRNDWDRWFWIWRSQPRRGWPKIHPEIRVLIRRMATENVGWGAPKIHGELRKLGFDLSERMVARYWRRLQRRGDPKQRWRAFLANHREAMVAMDFFTVPTLTFQFLYCFFVIEQERRRILHCNVTRHPTSAWVVPQRREAFPEADCAYKKLKSRARPRIRDSQ